MREASILLTSFRQRENARPLRGGRLPAIDGGTAGRVFDGERWRGKEAKNLSMFIPVPAEATAERGGIGTVRKDVLNL